MGPKPASNRPSQATSTPAGNAAKPPAGGQPTASAPSSAASTLSGAASALAGQIAGQAAPAVVGAVTETAPPGSPPPQSGGSIGGITGGQDSKTLLQSFSEGLPDVPIFDDTPNMTKLDKNKNKSTMAQELISSWEEREVQTITNNVKDDKLKSIKMLEQHQLAPLEPTLMLKSESDLVAAARMYLLNPVNVAIQALLDDPANKFKGHGKKLRCFAEWEAGTGTSNASRFDVFYVFDSTDPTAKKRTANDIISKKENSVAVVEFKKTNTIHVKEWLDAKRTASEWTRGRGTASLLTADTAVALVKQAIKYCGSGDSGSSGTPHVAMFDWQTLFLLDFSGIKLGVNVAPNAQGAPKVAKGTLFQEKPADANKPTDPKRQPGLEVSNFRRILLGWLVGILSAGFSDSKSPANQQPLPLRPGGAPSAPPGTDGKSKGKA